MSEPIRLARCLDFAGRFLDDLAVRVFGRLRVIWPLGLALVRPGVPGLLVDDDHVSRVVTAWTLTATAGRAALVAAWGLLADATSPRWALAAAGVLLLATPLLLPRGATEPRADSSAWSRYR